MPPGKDNCYWRSVRPQTTRPPRVYLCPSTVAGIPSRLKLVGKGGGHRTRCGRELHLHRTTARVCCIAIHVPMTDHLSVVYPQAG